MALERLQKIIAAAGIASRRKAEELIQTGLVSVNGNTVTELGSKADPETDSIRVNNKLLAGAERHEYIVMNKPRGYVTTVSDPEGRPTIMELVRSKARLYPVGRLDFNSEGLLLLTNDGTLAHKLMKAASHIPKTYLVKVSGQPGEDQLRRLRAGVSIAEERNPSKRVRTAPAQIRVIKEADNPWLEVTLHEGRNRQIRKMFEEIGRHVEKIRRVRYGPLELDLPPGESRPLAAQEVSRLLRATEPAAPSRIQPERERSSFGVRRREAPRQGLGDRERKGPPAPARRESKTGFSDRPAREFRAERSGRDQTRRPSARYGAPHPRPEGRVESKSFDRPRRERREGAPPKFTGRFERKDRDQRSSFGRGRGPLQEGDERRPPLREERAPGLSKPPRSRDERPDRPFGFKQQRREGASPRGGARSSSARRDESSRAGAGAAPPRRGPRPGSASNRGRSGGGQRPTRGNRPGRS
jgi:23S rRNA pseudouridine2605 synthase